ncbi:PAS domain S-box protein [Planomonospora sp. ID67723]|uniref:PAS domain S-box protein n=1 Tax=Planomonospora sp. ID67723 TaxID=2738134 RepID=UPI0018C41794|nr:PAS domain S-box protein [Planomonospora sp. ID67723]MBG0831998.1 PAS domain S-box protein [Planomonospora sp. ID67723]
MGSVERLGDAPELQAILENAHDAFISLDDVGRVRAWNAATEQLFGWSAEEALGRSVIDLIAPAALRDRYDRGLRVLYEHGPSVLPGHRLELTVTDRAGREFPIEMALQTGTDARGALVVHAFVHDISARHAAQRELEAERIFLQALLDSLDVGVVACDHQGRATVVNQMVRQLYRVMPDPRIDQESWPQAYHLFTPDGHTLLRPEQVPLARALAGECVDGQHLMICPPEGAAHRCLVNARPITTADGQRLGAVLAVRDITSQHRAQVLRDAQHAVARALAEASGSEQAVTGAVAAVTQALGWTYGEYWQVAHEQQVMTRTSSWHLPDRDLEPFVGEQSAVVRRGQGLPGMVWDRGQAEWICDLQADARSFRLKQAALQAGLRAAIALPVRSDRQVLGVLIFCADTVQQADDELIDLLDGICAHIGRYLERRRAEELALDLAESRRHFDQVISQLDDNVWTTEITPDGQLRSMFEGSNVAAVLGVEPPEGVNVGMLLTERVHPEDRAVWDGFRAELIAGRPAQGECRVIGLDGVTRWIWMRGTPRREGGRAFVDGISTDVTERHRLAEERDRMKDELVALVSHELRNPIGAIRGYVEMLLDTPGLTGVQRMFADVIDRTSAHLLHLSDNLLDLARLDAGHITVDARPVSLTRLVRQAVADHRAAAEAKHLSIGIETHLHPPVHADPLRLRQVLDNLLSNAIKYTPDGGTVTLTTGSSGEDADTGEHAAVIAVADTGIGIPSEQYGQLFSRFFRASSAQEAGIKGTGLGLAITKAIVEAHGGTITAGPREGGGTLVTVRLPAAAAVPS